MRPTIVERCVQQLVGNPGKPGHFFTIWAPRQCGKTWLMRRAIEEIRARHGNAFAIGALSMQGLLKADEGDEVFFRSVPDMFKEGFAFEPSAPADWNGWRRLFAKEGGLFDRPLILLIDEFDSLPPAVIDSLVQGFRKIYLAREGYTLHSLALIGVRAVLGVDSARGSPFNVQRSLHVPNLTRDEVSDMFAQYQGESGQVVQPEVVEALYTTTRGQPGLVGWFGELLTEKYNPGDGKPITGANWDEVFMLACRVEPNNTILNLIKKAKGPHREQVMGLFGKSDIPFSFDQDWCNYLYTNGIIDFERTQDEKGMPTSVCRFSSPFVQFRLHSALTDALVPGLPILALDPLDTLADVFTDQPLNAAPLLERYKGYLTRLKIAGQDPFQGEPRRNDMGLREAVGHFHLYAWLREAVRPLASVSPEFPTGNGKVDLFIRSRTHRAVIEVKSFRGAAELPMARRQAARYANSQNLPIATLALFVPVSDEEVLKKLSSDEVIDSVRVITVAIGWT
ncbi:MAG: hypothetical protein IPK82_34335 [Polyangiaceae bacterium]|nr:hypothetical protein [Polyangiaceae bacterium]